LKCQKYNVATKKFEKDSVACSWNEYVSYYLPLVGQTLEPKAETSGNSEWHLALGAKGWKYNSVAANFGSTKADENKVTKSILSRVNKVMKQYLGKYRNYYKSS